MLLIVLKLWTRHGRQLAIDDGHAHLVTTQGVGVTTLRKLHWEFNSCNYLFLQSNSH